MEDHADYRSGPIVWAATIASTCLLLYLFQKVLWLVVPFILALIIYYALLPLKLRLVLAGFGHDAATGLVSVGVFVGLALVLTLLLPKLLTDASTWQESASRYVEGGLSFLIATFRHLEGSVAMLARARLSEQLAGQIAELGDDFSRKYLATIAMTVAAWAPSLLLAPFLAFFMLRDGWRFKRFLGQAVPNAFFERTLCLLDQMDRTARLYFAGLLELTVLDTLCLAGGLWLLGVSAPLLLGLMTAVLAWIPYVGSIVGCVLVVLVAA
ncbi:MAG TPA: AI-2E family transporter, partial [Rhodocyclaceae bacterium]|nr:AI-2E family transporter [Rhodocyclaceae bacterium]